MSANTFAQLAMQALNANEPEKAVSYFQEALKAAVRPRPDIKNSLGVVLLQLGEPHQARPILEEAVEEAWEVGAEPALIHQCLLGLAAAAEDSDDAPAALAAYDQLLELDIHLNRAQAGRGHLHLAMGALDEAFADLDHYIAHGHDQSEYLQATQALLDAVKEFRSVGDPEVLLKAHREAYVEFFDETAKRMAEQGWIAECARMKRAEDGRVVLSIPEGARPYAGVRIDLVDPSTGQGGQVGEQPMVVAVGGFEPLAQAPVLFRVEEERRFPLYHSTQAPWDQLPIQVLRSTPDAVATLEPVFASWYTDGFEGRFGSPDAGRFHYISDPIEVREGHGVIFHVDLGRADLSCIEHLLTQLERVGVDKVILGRGHL